MKNNKKKERSIIILLIVAVLLMTVGFALYEQTLNITGSVTVKGKPWNVHYVNDDITETQGSVAANPKSVNDTDFSFTVTLNKPGDFYEATVKVKNEGTIGAVLKKIRLSPTLTAEQQNYLSYSVTYDGTAYTASNENLNLELAAGATKNVVVRINYIQPESASQLPSNDVTFTLDGHFDYESAT